MSENAGNTPEFRLETERLVLRNLAPEDLDGLARIHADPEVMHFWPAPYTREKTLEVIQWAMGRYCQDGVCLYGAVLKETGEFIGRIGYLRQKVNGAPELEIGYMLAREQWGKGLATEAAVALRDHAFRNLSLSWLPGEHVERVISLIRPENWPSRRVAERNGMRAVDETEHASMPHVVYAITRGEWEAISGL